MFQTRADAIGARTQRSEINGIVQIDRTAGPYDLVAMVRGLTDQAAVGTLERVRSLHGVLRRLLAPRIAADDAQETLRLEA